MDPPTGSMDGITVLAPDRARFQLRAPSKDHVHLRGDFNDWIIDPEWLMNQSSDGLTWWLEVEGLEPGAWTRFHYLVDDTVEVADPYSPLILDPWNDDYLSGETFPNRPNYPGGHALWPVGAFRTEVPEFVWTDQDFVKPPQDRLVIYELLVRDWDAAQDFDAVRARLDHLQWLGITAIELMPVSEFDGNSSWGYNPGPRFAVDKAYGNQESLKRLINEAHLRGMAVLLDVVPNHSFGLDPLVRLYQDADNGASAGNPWFNEDQIHPFGLGYDFNHGDPWTREFWKRVFDFWIDEFHVDGYRIDLSKGLTQNQTLGDVGAWNVYDQGRVDILFDYGNHIWSGHPGTYLILEHLGDNPEEAALANGGFMLWGKSTSSFAEAAMGYGGDFSWASWQARGWNWPNLVSYMESHDEQRVAHDLLAYGNSSGDYDTRDLATAMSRLAMSHAFLLALPGPKMMYQWGEFGYDVSIFSCPNGGEQEPCKLEEKPEPWNDRAIVPERQGLARKVKAVCDLKREQPVFGTYDYNIDFGGTGKRLHLYSPSQNAVLCGNFDVVGFDMVPGFPHTGLWTDALSGETVDVTDLGAAFYFAPGQYHLWMDTPVMWAGDDLPLALLPTCNHPEALNFGVGGTCQFELTVMLDATDLHALNSVSAEGLHVAGSFQGWSPGTTELVAVGEDVYAATFTAMEGDLVEFKFINGTDWPEAELVPSGCGWPDGFGGFNRQWLVSGPEAIGPYCFAGCAACSANLDFPGCTSPSAANFDETATVDDGSCEYNLLLQVDVSQEVDQPETVFVAGTFQGWDPSASPLMPVGDGIWAGNVTIVGNPTADYKFLSGPDWSMAEGVPEACGISNGSGGFNRTIDVNAPITTLPVVCFGACGDCDEDAENVDGSAFCGPGTFWDVDSELCVAVVACSEDLDGDGLVGVSDVLSLLSAFGQVCP